MAEEFEETAKKKDVVVANEINKVITGAWTAKEQDLFNVAMYKFRETKEKIITIESEELKGLGGFNKFNNVQFNKAVFDFSKKLGQTFIYQENSKSFKIQMLFESFEFSKDEAWLEIEATDFLLNAIKKTEEEFFAFSLDEAVFLKSKYSKILFRQLKQWRYVGVKEFGADELQRILGSPEKYSVASFRKEILTPTVKELQDNFVGLKIHILRASDLGRSKRGNPILRFRFTFQKEVKKKTKPKNNKKYIPMDEKSKANRTFKRSVKSARSRGVLLANAVDLRKLKD